MTAKAALYSHYTVTFDEIRSLMRSNAMSKCSTEHTKDSWEIIMFGNTRRYNTVFFKLCLQ